MFDYKLEHICSYSDTGSDARPVEVIGPVAEGLRVNFSTSGGGKVTGPRIQGTVRQAGGDWVVVRKDGVAVMDARTTFETDDGALILITYPGVTDFGEGGYDKFMRGDMPAKVRVRTAPRFSTSHPNYLWLNRLQCIGVGEYEPAARRVSYDVYAVI